MTVIHAFFLFAIRGFKMFFKGHVLQILVPSTLLSILIMTLVLFAAMLW